MNILPIELAGSLQNPAWSPDGKDLVFTQFTGGYNTGVSNIQTQSGILRIDDGSQNVNAPGSTWNASGIPNITYSSDHGDHDEIYVTSPAHILWQITSRPNNLAWEPSFSPDGKQIVFESHNLAGTDGGELWIVNTDGTGLFRLTGGFDDRQPNWSPDGNHIVFQSTCSGSWQLWLFEFGITTSLMQITNESYECTDATWHPDSSHVLFSRDAGLAVVNTVTGVITAVPGITPGWYAGAPSWSPDGKTIAFETCQGSPDGSPGTQIATVAFSL